MAKDREVNVIAQGAFMDTDPSFQNKMFMIRTWTVRLGPTILNEWLWSDPDLVSPACYETQEAYEADRQDKEKRREAAEKEIAEALHIEDGWSCAITQAVSEIFTVVSMEAIQCRN